MNGLGADDPEDVLSPGRADDGIDWLDPDEAGAGPVAVTVVDCWRCGKAVGSNLDACPYCRARLAVAADPGGATRVPPAVDVEIATSRLLYLYLAFLATSVIYGMTIDFSLFRKAPPTDEEIRLHLIKLLVVEAIDTVLVVAGIAWLRRPMAFPAVHPRRRLVAWLAAAPTLVLLLTANFAYFRLLKDGLGLPVADDAFSDHPELIPWVVLGLCVQPAIVEEIFFRYLAIGHLRAVVGTHGAVWIAAVMFGMAHLFNPLGTPYLILAGAVFGYVRVYGRGLAIPILMHFAHNAIVIWSEPWL